VLLIGGTKPNYIIYELCIDAFILIRAVDIFCGFMLLLELVLPIACMPLIGSFFLVESDVKLWRYKACFSKISKNELGWAI